MDASNVFKIVIFRILHAANVGAVEYHLDYTVVHDETYLRENRQCQMTMDFLCDSSSYTNAYTITHAVSTVICDTSDFHLCSNILLIAPKTWFLRTLDPFPSLRKTIPNCDGEFFWEELEEEEEAENSIDGTYYVAGCGPYIHLQLYYYIQVTITSNPQ